jgi:hypothetical protein
VTLTKVGCVTFQLWDCSVDREWADASAALYATVSASFMVEQAGLPRLEKVEEGVIQKELWNGVDPKARLEVLRSKVVLV